ncbi:MAG: hypothetical protein K9N23_05355 [Akkermansiaceae bacterium]|nr:hypothetical protein [Akkermansiaceae bacterium]
MDPTRDNPIIRFNTFWWALWAFFAFAIVLAAIMIFNRAAPTNLEDAVAVARYQTQQTVAEAQAKALPAADIEAAIPEVAAKLAASKPVAVERPDQVVPESPTSKALIAEPALGPTTEPAPVPVPAPAPAPATEGTPAETDAPAPVNS